MNERRMMEQAKRLLEQQLKDLVEVENRLEGELVTRRAEVGWVERLLAEQRALVARHKKVLSEYPG